jgi:hypothetical protein
VLLLLRLHYQIEARLWSDGPCTINCYPGFLERRSLTATVIHCVLDRFFGYTHPPSALVCLLEFLDEPTETLYEVHHLYDQIVGNLNTENHYHELPEYSLLLFFTHPLSILINLGYECAYEEQSQTHTIQ